MKYKEKSATHQVYDWITNNKKIGEFVDSSEVREGLNFSANIISSSLNNLEKREMLIAVEKHTPTNGHKLIYKYQIIDFPNLKFTKKPKDTIRIRIKGIRFKHRNIPIEDGHTHKIKNYKNVAEALGDAECLIGMFEEVINGNNPDVSELKLILEASKDVRDRIKRLVK